MSAVGILAGLVLALLAVLLLGALLPPPARGGPAGPYDRSPRRPPWLGAASDDPALIARLARAGY